MHNYTHTHTVHALCEVHAKKGRLALQWGSGFMYIPTRPAATQLQPVAT